MNNEIKVFNYEGMAEVRTVVKDGEVWFVAKDVCDVLEIKNPTDALKRLDEDERSRFNLGRQGFTNIINEAGLYTLILGSRKPEAKRFKRWVTHEVIPSIRKHGAYMTPETIERTLTDPDFIIRLATQLKEEQQRRMELEAENEVMKPIVDKYERFLDSEGLATKTAVAKMISAGYGISLSAQRLNQYLRDKGILSKKRIDGDFMPNKGYEPYFRVIPRTFYDSTYGSYRTKNQVKITPEGIDFILELFEENFGETIRPKQ